MTNEERIAELEKQLKKLQSKQSELSKQLAKAQIDQWQARIEDLEVQLHLGAMETSDRVTTLMDQLRSRWSDARRQFEDAAATAGTVADTVRTGLESAFREVSRTLLETKNLLS